jgi:ribosomal protein S1
VIKRSLLPIGDKVLKVGDKVKTRAINGETFSGEIISLDRYGFAIVKINNISEARVALSQLEKGE